jgi:hypothetical protein
LGGSGGRLRITPSATYNTADRTFEWWMNIESPVTTITNYFEREGVSTELRLLVYTNNRIELRWVHSSNVTYVSPQYQLTQGQWHHVAITKTGNTISLFLDGVLQHTATPGAFVESGSTYWNIGSTTGISYVDSIRISDVNRYSGNFAPPEEIFISDANTLFNLEFDDVGVISTMTATAN